jgi:hypothetical protein
VAEYLCAEASLKADPMPLPEQEHSPLSAQHLHDDAEQESKRQEGNVCTFDGMPRGMQVECSKCCHGSRRQAEHYDDGRQDAAGACKGCVDR